MTSNTSAAILSQANGSLSTAKMVALLSPKASVLLLFGPAFLLPGIYAKYYGLSLTTIAYILFVTRLFDTITDPLIGYCSDRYFAYKGSRKPFILAGGILAVISSYFLFVPVDPAVVTPQQPGQPITPANVSATYFLLAISAYYLAMTLFRIPFLAWGSELTTTSRERSKLFSLILVITFVAQVLFFALPLLGVFETNEFTPEVLQWSVFIAGITLLPTLLICVKTVPDGHNPVSKKDRLTPKKTLFILLHNPPLLLLLSAIFFVFIAIGMWLGLLFIFVDSYLAWGQHLSLSYCLSYSLGALLMWVWHRFTVRLGKKTSFMISIILASLGILCATFLSPTGHWLLLLFVMILFYSGAAAINSIELSLLGDVADYSTLKSGHDQTATYFAIHNVVNKIGSTVGSALGIAVAGWYGFDPSQTTHSAEAVQGLYLSFVALPIPFMLVGLVFAAYIPINERRYKIIRRRLNVRKLREAHPFPQGTGV